VERKFMNGSVEIRKPVQHRPLLDTDQPISASVRSKVSSNSFPKCRAT
jgi:hypothetical protein